MRSAPEQLVELVRNTVEPMGYELVGAEYVGGGKGRNILRVYIDQESGITLDDCVAVSRQLSSVLDVEDPIAENYELEVSSPGLDRPLYQPEHFERFAGEKIRVRLARAIDGRRKFEGVLKGLTNGLVTIETDGGDIDLPFEDIDSARLVPKF